MTGPKSLRDPSVKPPLGSGLDSVRHCCRRHMSNSVSIQTFLGEDVMRMEAVTNDPSETESTDSFANSGDYQ
jgi:hypothetical protein